MVGNERDVVVSQSAKVYRISSNGYINPKKEKKKNYVNTPKKMHFSITYMSIRQFFNLIWKEKIGKSRVLVQ